MLQRVFLFIFFISLLNTISLAQNVALELKNYTRKDGLPSNETYYILRDSKNYLWIATDQGVVRFDGEEMKKFELEDNVIFKIKEDEKGRIWFFSKSGKLAYYENGIVHNFAYNKELLAKVKNITIIDALVYKDTIYINSQNGENYKVSLSGKIDNFFYGIPNSEMHFDIKMYGNLFFATKTLGHIYGGHNFFLLKKNSYDTIIYKIPFRQAVYYHYGVIAHDNILYFYHDKTMVKLYPDGNYKHIYMNDQILDMKFDLENNIWVGLREGGAILLNKNLEPIGNTVLKQYSISSIENDFEGGTWFSTLENGLFYLKKTANNKYIDSTINLPSFRTFPTNDSAFLVLNANGVFQISSGIASPIWGNKMSSGTFLFANKNSIVVGSNSYNKELKLDAYGNFFTLRNVNFKRIYSLVTNSEFVFTADSNTVFNIGDNLYFTKKFEQLKSKINPYRVISFHRSNLFSDITHQVWAGTVNALYKMSTINDSFYHFKFNEPLFQKGVTNMAQMGSGLYAIGIRFGGLAIMKDSTVIDNITEANGLSSNSIKYILPHKNYLWVATAKGISIVYFTSFSPLQYKIINVAGGKDFADITVNHLSYLGKDVLAATNNGIYRFNDSLIIAESNIVKPLPFYITAIRYNNIDTTNISSLSVPYNSARITINFNAISFANGDDIQYRYRIANIDTTWSYLKNPELLLENLSPGAYKVQLQALIKYQDRYSEIRELNITVEKPWWQNNYVRLLTAFIILLCGYAFYQSRIKKINAAAKKELATKSKFLELEQTALRSQMNPHFIFNCLSSIQQLIVSGEGEKANEYLVKFSRLMRLTLELSASPYNSIADEINYLSEYISLEQLRFPNKFDFSISINNEMDKNSIAIPNMMIQPIVENAINHGIKNVKNRVGFISINLVLEYAVLICTIKDNGVGRNTNKKMIDDYKAHKSFGMDIITKRLVTFNAEGEAAYKMEVIDLKDQHNEPSGTEVILHLPIKKLL